MCPLDEGYHAEAGYFGPGIQKTPGLCGRGFSCGVAGTGFEPVTSGL